jgi:hypothetical protein
MAGRGLKIGCVLLVGTSITNCGGTVDRGGADRGNEAGSNGYVGTIGGQTGAVTGTMISGTSGDVGYYGGRGPDIGGYTGAGAANIGGYVGGGGSNIGGFVGTAPLGGEAPIGGNGEVGAGAPGVAGGEGGTGAVGVPPEGGVGGA